MIFTYYTICNVYNNCQRISSRQAFLQELYNRAGSDFEVQISMYDIGADLGLGKGEADELAQGLFIENH